MSTLIRTHVFSRIDCMWHWRWLTTQAWSALPHVAAASLAIVCTGYPPVVPPAPPPVPPVTWIPPFPPPWPPSGETPPPGPPGGYVPPVEAFVPGGWNGSVWGSGSGNGGDVSRVGASVAPPMGSPPVVIDMGAGPVIEISRPLVTSASDVPEPAWAWLAMLPGIVWWRWRMPSAGKGEE